jgi:DsbC/DsbD-like thiol-disulfide interchange protein
MRSVCLVLALSSPLAVAAQTVAPPDFSSLTSTHKKRIQYVEYAAEQQIVPAGKQTVLELRFHVVDGFHINSHSPKSDLQIPTRIVLKPAPGITLGKATYPAGTPFSFSFAPQDKLDVYQGQFLVDLPVTATAGSHELDAELRYQACDRAACYPPMLLPVAIVFTAK